MFIVVKSNEQVSKQKIESLKQQEFFVRSPAVLRITMTEAIIWSRDTTAEYIKDRTLV